MLRMKPVLVYLIFCLTLGPTAIAFDPRLDLVPCWTPPSDASSTDCAWLAVPERWDSPGGRTIKLPVAVFRPRNPDPSLGPVIFLSGGPGIPALGPDGTSIPGWRATADRLYPNRTLVAFDQRGTGLASPRLACPDGDGPTVWWPVSSDPDDFGNRSVRVHTAYAACRDRLAAAGHDLSAFTTRQSAADVAALVRALELGPAVLLGQSYGTRLALTVMRDQPRVVAAAVLDSVFPPGAMVSGFDGELFGAVLDRLIAACGAHDRCALAYPDLRSTFLAVLERLAATPLVLPIRNLAGGDPLYARVDHRMFLEVLRSEMYHSGRIGGLPALIAGLAKGETWRLTPHVENTVYGFFPRAFDMGMTLSAACRDALSAPRRVSDVDGTGPYPYLSDYIAWMHDLDPCAVWPVDAVDAEEGEAVVSVIPTLLLAGGFDSSTPVELAEGAAETLSGSHLFVFPANAHDQLGSSDCALTVTLRFLADPQTRPDPPCLATLRAPSFLALGGG